MALTLTDEALLRARLHALGLDGAGAADTEARSTGPERVRGVVAHLFALQGQDWRSSRWAVGVRAPGTTSADVVAALNVGAVVRSWPMRGTVHLVPAEDIGWMQQLTNPRVVAGAAKRRAFLGMSDAVLERATEVSLAALAGTSLTRTELSQAWTDAGIDWQPSWRYHLIWWLCQNGFTTFGPVSERAAAQADPEPRLVLAEEWIPRPRSLAGEDALAEFAARYVRGRGAVSRKDLASWAMLPAASAARGLALAVEQGAIVEARREGVTGVAGALWAAPDALAAAESAASGVDQDRWQLLPAFDEHLLGFSDRSPQFDAAHLGQLIPGKNGMFLATVVRGGRAVGTWRRDPKTRAIVCSPFAGEQLDLNALAGAVPPLAAFYGDPEPELALATP